MKMIPIKEESLNNLFCFGDLYLSLGIDKLSEKYGGFIHSVEQIKANKKTLDHIHEVFVKNVKISKDKRVKSYKQEYRGHLVAWDFVMWAPTTDESIPDMTFGLDEDKEKYDKIS